MKILKCKVRGCKNLLWQRASGLPSVVCEKHADMIVKRIPLALDNLAKTK